MRRQVVMFALLGMFVLCATGAWAVDIPVTNGSFEDTVPGTDELDYWAAADTGAAVSCPVVGSAQDGERVLEIDATGGYGYVWGPFGDYSPDVQVEAHKMYTMSVWVSKVPGKTCPGATLRLYTVPERGVFDTGTTGMSIELISDPQTVDWEWVRYDLRLDSNMYPAVVGQYFLFSFRVDDGAAVFDNVTFSSVDAPASGITNASFEVAKSDGTPWAWVSAGTGASYTCVADSHAVDGERVLQIVAPAPDGYGYVWGPVGAYAPPDQVELYTRYMMSVWVSKVPGMDCPGTDLRFLIVPERGVFNTDPNGTSANVWTEPMTEDWAWTKYTLEYDSSFYGSEQLGYFFLFMLYVVQPQYYGGGAANFDMVTLDHEHYRTVTIDEARKAQDGEYVVIPHAIVTGKFFSDDAYIGYAVEEPDRSAGIRVISYVSAPSPGYDLAVAGTVETIDGERVINMGSRRRVRNSTGNPVPKPLAMTNKSAGGGTYGEQGAVVDDAASSKMSAGMNNVGLVVKLFGKVTSVNDTGMYDGYFYVDDGSGINDGSGNIGIRCRPMGTSLTPAALPALDSYVTVTGVMGVHKVDDVNARFIWTTAVN